jgi:putative ABC transport system permease protein
VEGGPVLGEVWLDERLLNVLRLTPGAAITLGKTTLRVAAILTHEPDRGMNFFSVAPRLLMHLDDLAATGLVQTGSRLTYRLLLAGEAGLLANFQRSLENRLERGERLEDASNARPEIRTLLDRAERFLGLATLLTVTLAAVSVALAARRYLQRHLDACAVMRCFGLTQGGLLRLHAALFVGLAALAVLLGGVVGFAAHFLLLDWLGGLLAIDLPASGGLPLLQGGAVAAVLLFGFAFPPLLQLAKVPTLRVLRRELGPPQSTLLGGYALGWLGLAALMLAVAGEIKLGAWIIAGFTGALAAFWLFAWLVLRLISRWRIAGSFALRQGLANLQRHSLSATIQTVALALGLMALLLLTVTRGELLDVWQKSIPPDAPNRFIINIQPDQKVALGAMLEEAGIKAELSPMLRGRLIKIGEQPVSAANFPQDERAQRLIEREFNLSWRADLPPGNEILAGRWFEPAPAPQNQASIEAGLAKTLNIHLGDELVFMISGQEVPVRVENLRKLAWDSLRVNFFVLTPPDVLDPANASYITSFYLPEQQMALGPELTRRFPNLTLIDVSAILRQLETVTGQVTMAVQFVFLFTLGAGLIVLYASLLSALDERRHELAILRALGAQRRQLQQALLLELFTVGGLAGLLAAVGASLLGQLLARQVFQLSLPWSLWLLPAASLFGGLLSAGVGWWALRALLNTPPMLALRANA